MNLNLQYMKTLSGIMKTVEIVCVVLAFVLVRVSEIVCGYSSHAQYFAVGVLVAAMIVTPLQLASYVVAKQQVQNSFLEIAQNALFALFLFAVGVEALSASAHWHPDRKCLVMGIFSFVASMAYIVDTVFCVIVRFRNT